MTFVIFLFQTVSNLPDNNFDSFIIAAKKQTAYMKKGNRNHVDRQWYETIETQR